MRKSSIIIAGIAALTLAGCAGSVGTTPTLPGTPAPQPSKVKTAILQGCGYVATIESIAAIISASPFVPAAGAVADAVCNAVTTLPLADGPGDRKARVNGVVVDGYFAKRR